MPLDGTPGAAPDLGSIDVDGLMAQIESGQETNSDPASIGGGTNPTSTQAATAPAQTASELEFTWNGKQIKAPYADPRVKQWASQGYDYAQRMAEFNRQQQDFQAKSAKVQESESRYQPVEKYIEQNPQWWEHVNNSWKQLQSQGLGVDPNNPVVQKLSAYEQKLSQIEQFIQSAQAKEQRAVEEQEMQALDAEIKSMRETYGDHDWTTPDAEGQTLELRVLKYAHENGIRKFTTAFNDLMAPELIKRASEQAKESVVKERQKQTKLGLLGKSQSPRAGITTPTDIKNKSYEELVQEGLKELALG